MIHTNKHGLPHYAQTWLENDNYDYEPDVISGTKLLSPARQYALYKRHYDELETDISDLVASTYGTALHDSVENVKIKGAEQETRLYAYVEVDGKTFKISGKFDILLDMDKEVQKLVDVKSTSAWAWVDCKKEIEYIKQLSIYRFIANSGENAKKYNIGEDAEIMMVFTDWSKGTARRKPDYPQLRIAIKKIKLWDHATTEAYIKERLRLFRAAEESPEETMMECPDKELWKDNDKWAIMKEGRKTAVKLCESEEEAAKYFASKGLDDKHYVETRKSCAKRCEYCNATKFCSQYKRLLEDGRISSDKENKNIIGGN